jgi:hypothetical protein
MVIGVRNSWPATPAINSRLHQFEKTPDRSTSPPASGISVIPDQQRTADARVHRLLDARAHLGSIFWRQLCQALISPWARYFAIDPERGLVGG